MLKHSTTTQDLNYINAQQGFTLIELMITVAIASLLLTMAVPSFNTMTKNNRLTSNVNQLVAALNLARSEAITRRATIDVVATDSTNAANEWGQGWSVGVNGGATLRIFEALKGGTTLDSSGGIGTVQYLSNGRASVADVFTLCDDRTGETGRQITILVTGRLSVEQTVCS